MNEPRLPSKVVWFKDIERPKTVYLKRGLEELGVPIQHSERLIQEMNPPRNRLGPYIYPIEFHFGNKKVLALYDIGTNPAIFYSRFMKANRPYFKIHLRKKDAKRYPNLFVAPNSPSRLEYLDHLPGLKILKDQKKYIRDFMFIGWHDDGGFRMETVKKIRHMRIESIATLLPFKHHTKVPKYLLGERLEYHQHLIEQSLSKLNLALPGGFARPYCSFRHVELWGMGAAVLTTKPDSVLPGNPREISIEYTLEKLPEVVKHYLHNDEEREHIASRGRAYFNEYLTPTANALYIIKKAESMLQKGRP